MSDCNKRYMILCKNYLQWSRINLFVVLCSAGLWLGVYHIVIGMVKNSNRIRSKYNKKDCKGTSQ